jgi:hypothetical protein
VTDHKAEKDARLANICCGHATCQREVREAMSTAWEAGYLAALLSAPEDAKTVENPYVIPPEGSPS